jgi:hypothetical protein
MSDDPDPQYQYRWLTDESEDASGDCIVYADESEYADAGDDSDW